MFELEYNVSQSLLGLGACLHNSLIENNAAMKGLLITSVTFH